MNIHDIFPEIYNKINEDKKDFSPEVVAKNIIESPYFEIIKDKFLSLSKEMEKIKKDSKEMDQDAAIRLAFSDKVILHGSPRSNIGEFKYISFKERDQPKDTSEFIHNYVNKLSKKMYGHRIRNGMFVTTKTKSASGYGSVYVIFPLGDYKIYYSHGVADFTDEFGAASHDEFGGHFTSRLIGQLSCQLDDSKSFKDNVEEDAMSFFSRIYEEIEEETFKSFTDFKSRIVEVAEENLKEVINNHDNYDKVMNTIKRNVAIAVNNYGSEMKQYVENIEETKDPSDFYQFEGMMFFKNAIAIELDSDYFIELVLEIIAKI